MKDVFVYQPPGGPAQVALFIAGLDGIRGDLHSKGAGREGQRQQQGQDALFHSFSFLLHKNPAPARASAAARVSAMWMGFMMA